MGVAIYLHATLSMFNSRHILALSATGDFTTRLPEAREHERQCSASARRGFGLKNDSAHFSLPA